MIHTRTHLRFRSARSLGRRPPPAIRRLSFAVVWLASVLLLVSGAGTSAMASTSVPVTIQSVITVGPFTGTWSASGGISDSGTLAGNPVNFVGNGQLHVVRVVAGAQGTFTEGETAGRLCAWLGDGAY